MREDLTKQNRNIFHLLLLIIFVSGFYSCEFDSHDDNYVHIEKPKDEILLGIDLAGVNPEDIIYVTNHSYFTYTLYTDNKEILVQQFFLDGNPLDIDWQTGAAILNTNITDRDIHELKLVIGLKTGSGSLADHARLEMYTGEFTFKIKFIPYSDDLNIRETTDSYGSLKLEWDKPIDYEVVGYEIYKGEWISKELLASIDDPDETFFVDLDYVYGYKHYNVVAKVKNSSGLTVEDNITVRYENLTEEHFETYRISANSIYIGWTNPNPFPCKYVLVYDYDKQIIVENGKNEVIIPDYVFPVGTLTFSLYILPENEDVNCYHAYSYVYGSYHDKTFSAINFSADIHNKQIHALDFDELSSFDAFSMEKTSSGKHNLRLHTGCKIQISADGKVAIDDADGFIHIYSDYSLTNKIAKLNNYWYFPFRLTSNNKIIFEKRSGFEIQDFRTGKIICSKTWQSSDEYGEVLIKANISSDGKYVYVRCQEYLFPYNNVWTELFEIDNNNLTLLEKTEIKENITSVSFHPLKPTEAIIQYSPYYENKFVIVDILTKEKKEIKGEFMDVDLFTGNILYKSEEDMNDGYNVYIKDKTYTKDIMKIKLANLNFWDLISLINNHLFFSEYYLNLSDLKE